ncbi:phage minor tail protein L [Cupriavidus metallidurans]|uniref:phage minor tail protein L n=1 Tax=Cupriavidus metallidurans TaxID=119219 RepID=UPI001CCD0141|nr:phage minor tail protein L [Cupriavidus metallidurans]UBM12753.1 phage minor tail protein L [Cupriavidus metallidurans]
MTIHSEIRSLSPSQLIELFVLDAGPQGGPSYYFHSGLSGNMTPIVWQGVTYTPIPMESTDFETKSNGALPSPRIRFANMQGAIAAEARQFNGFAGCRVIRKRTFARYLDAVNFPNGNHEADPYQCLPEDIWYVDRRPHEDYDIVEFELVSAMELRGVKIPRRQIIASCCPSVYRGAECGYTGPPVADELNAPTADPSKDMCSKSLTGCRFRFPNKPLPFGGFPGTGMIR